MPSTSAPNVFVGCYAGVSASPGFSLIPPKPLTPPKSASYGRN